MEDLAYQMCDPLEYMKGLRDTTVRCGGFQFHREGQQIREEREKGVRE